MKVKKFLLCLFLATFVVIAPLFAFAQSQAYLSPDQIRLSISQLLTLVQQLQHQLAVLRMQQNQLVYPPVVNLQQPVSNTSTTLGMGQLPEKYLRVLNNSKINTAINSPESLSSIESNFLKDRITDLEKFETNNWNQYRFQATSKELDTRKIWLLQVALSVYTEANHLLPWSIVDYTPEQLKILLSYPKVVDKNAWQQLQATTFNNNPILARNYAEHLSNKYRYAKLTPKDFLYSLVKQMRSDGWVHLTGRSYEEICGLEDGLVEDFNCLQRIKKGTSSHTPYFIKAVLAAFNIPSQIVRPYFGHGGIFFPTVNLAMDGDAVYNSYLAGLLIRPNKIPIEHSFKDLDLTKNRLNMPVCRGAWLDIRDDILAYLSLYNKPEWRDDLIAAYKRSNSNGAWLKEGIISNTIPNSFCQTTNMDSSNFWAPLLSESEWSSWLGKISSVAGE